MVPFGRPAAFLIESFNWASLGGGKVVDIGGSSGGVSILLAEAFPHLNFVVQDLGLPLRVPRTTRFHQPSQIVLSSRLMTSSPSSLYRGASIFCWTIVNTVGGDVGILVIVCI